MWGDVQPISPVRVDGITLMAPGEPYRRGFMLANDGVWRRDGWRAAELRGRHGETFTRATAEAEGLPRGIDIDDMEDAWATRMDVCMDVQGEAPVCLELYDYLSGSRGSDGHKRSDFGKALTVYYGGDRSAVRMRIYTKAYKGRPPPAWLEEVWDGWDGRPVTRVEFQLTGAAVKGVMAGDVARVARGRFVDATTRMRLHAKRVSLYSQAQKCPESPAWAKLRAAPPKKEPRVRAPESLRAVEENLLRIIRAHARGGADVRKVLEEFAKAGPAEEVDAASKRVAKRLKQQEDYLWRLEREDLVCVSHGEDEESGEATGERSEGREECT